MASGCTASPACWPRTRTSPGTCGRRRRRALAARTAPAEGPAARVWLFRILRNAWIDTLRRRRAEAPLPKEAPPDPAGPWRHDASLVAEITVRQALARLPMPQREVVALVDIAGFSYAEAAEALGLPAGTVMSRLSRARAALLAEIAGARVVPLRRAAP